MSQGGDGVGAERELADDPAASPIALAVAYSHLGREREARALIADFKTAWREVMAEPPNLGSLEMIYPFRAAADRERFIGALDRVFWE